MRIRWVTLAAAALLGLAACSSNNNSLEGGRPDNGSTPPPTAQTLDELVKQQCRRSPENEDPTAINGRGFSASPGDFSTCL